MIEARTSWSTTERERLDRLGDVLIPSDGDMPSVSESDPQPRPACAGLHQLHT
jgi:hypothetical protein